MAFDMKKTTIATLPFSDRVLRGYKIQFESRDG